MNRNIKKGAYVLYGKTGVCLVEDKQEMTFGSAVGEYYVLRPVSDNRSAVYVPCDNPQLMAQMRTPMSRQELEALLDSLAGDAMPWIEDKNERLPALRAVLSTGDRRQMLLLIRCMYEKKQEKAAAGKHLSTADEMLLQEAMRLLEEEFALALEIPRAEVAAYIHDRLAGENEK